MIKLLLFFSGTIFSAAAQILLKGNVSETSSSLVRNMFSWSIILPVFLYFLSFVSYAAFLRTSELTLASPLFVGGVVLLIFVYGIVGGEHITLMRTFGAALVVSGIFLIQFSAG